MSLSCQGAWCIVQGRTPLWLACDAGHADHVEVLLGAGAEVDAKSFPHKKYQILMGVRTSSRPVPSLSLMTATHVAKVSCHVPHWLYSSHVSSLSVCVCDTQGSTPLHQAAMHGHTNVVQSLLAYGADANARTADVRTPGCFHSCWCCHLVCCSVVSVSKCHLTSCIKLSACRRRRTA